MKGLSVLEGVVEVKSFSVVEVKSLKVYKNLVPAWKQTKSGLKVCLN